MFMFCPDLLVCLHTVGHAPHHTPLQDKTMILKCKSPQNQQKKAPCHLISFSHKDLEKIN